jgi:Flp pilus assembly protein TadG
MSTQLDSLGGMLASDGGIETDSPILLPGHPKFGTGLGLKVEKVCRSCRRNRRGAAAVEFAVVSPVLFLLIFGMIEYGRMVMVQQVITNAAREGARKGVLDGSTNSDVTTVVGNYLTSANISGATTTVTPTNPSNATYGGTVTVSVSVPYSKVSWLPHSFWLGSKTLTATSVMRRESVQ